MHEEGTVNSIRTVTLDAVGTLLRVREPVGRTYSRLARELGVVVPPERLETAFRAALRSAPALAFPNLPERDRLRGERRWWKGVVSATFRAAGAESLPDSLHEDLFHLYSGGNAWALYDDVLPALRELKNDRYRLAVISNFDSRLRGVLEALGTSHLFDTLVCSSMAGSAKPDPTIFRYTLQTLGERPERAVHVGDDPLADVTGARRAGMIALLIAREPAVPAGTSPSDTIRSLHELKEKLTIARRTE